MEFIDYYKLLEIPKTAAEAEIKTAFRKLARKHHPDLNPNDESAKQKFQLINEANEVLGNPEKRKKYDKYGKDWKHADEFEKANQQQNQYNSNSGRQQNTSDYSDFFKSMYGEGFGSRNRQTKFRGEDINAELRFTLKDVYTTQKQTITVNGKNILLTVFAGTENGQVVKLAGYGNPGVNGGPNGDLYITFVITNDTKFKREGNHLYTNIDLDLYTAMLGGDLMVDTFDGKVKLKIIPETQSGTKVRLKGKGFPIYKKDNEFGDLFITYQVKLPTNLTEKEKELFTELSKIRNNGN